MTQDEAIEDWESRGIVVLGLFGYDPEQNTIVFRVLRGIVPEEFYAIMSKAGIKGLITRED